MRYARPVRWEGQSPSLSLPLSRELVELLLAVDRGCESDRCEALPSAVPSGRVTSWEFPGINPWAELCSPCGAKNADAQEGKRGRLTFLGKPRHSTHNILIFVPFKWLIVCESLDDRSMI